MNLQYNKQKLQYEGEKMKTSKFKKIGKVISLFTALVMLISTFVTSMGGFMPSFAEDEGTPNDNTHVAFKFIAVRASGGTYGVKGVDFKVTKVDDDSFYANLTFDDRDGVYGGLKAVDESGAESKYATKLATLYNGSNVDVPAIYLKKGETYLIEPKEPLTPGYQTDDKPYLKIQVNEDGTYNRLAKPHITTGADGSAVSALGYTAFKLTQGTNFKLIKLDQDGNPIEGVKFKMRVGYYDPLQGKATGDIDLGEFETNEKGELVNSLETSSMHSGSTTRLKAGFDPYTIFTGGFNTGGATNWEFFLDEQPLSDKIKEEYNTDGNTPLRIKIYRESSGYSTPVVAKLIVNGELKDDINILTYETVDMYPVNNSTAKGTSLPLAVITAKNNVTKKVAKKGEFKVVKKDSVTDTTIAGAEFTLTKGTLAENVFTPGSPAVTQSAVTTASGDISFTGLEDGVYKLEETKVPEGYDNTKPSVAYVKVEGAAASLLETPKASNVEVDVADILTLTAKNTPVEKTYKTYIYKIDKDTKAPLSGVEFAIYKVNEQFGRIDNSIITLTTDKNGKTTMVSLTSGKYEILETKVPAGYKSDSMAKGYVSITSSGAIELITSPAAINMSVGKDTDGVSYFTAENVKDNVPGPGPGPGPDTVTVNNPGGDTTIVKDNTQNDELNDGNTEVNADDKPMTGDSEEEINFDKALPQTGGIVDSNLLYAMGAILIAIGVVLATRKKINE